MFLAFKEQIIDFTIASGGRGNLCLNIINIYYNAYALNQ